MIDTECPSVRLSRIARVMPSSVDKKSEDDEPKVLLCNYTDVYYNETITSDLPFMAATASAADIEKFELRKGDVIITKDSETADDIGVPAYVPEALPGVVCGYHLSVIRLDSELVRPEFLYWFMHSFSTRHKLGSLATGVTRFGIRLEAVQSLQVPVPPLDIQEKLVGEIRSEVARIDRALGLLGGTKSAPDGSLPQLLLEERVAVVDELINGRSGSV